MNCVLLFEWELNTYKYICDVNNDLAKMYIIKQGVWSFCTAHLWVPPLCMTPDASADMPTEHFYEWVHPLGSEPSRLVLVSRRTPSCSVQALPRWACVNGPSPRLNITPLQKRKSETVGKESSSNQKRFENLADTTLFLLSPFVGYSLSHIVLNHFVAPGGAGGARSGRRIVRMQTGRHGHCMRLGIYGGTDGWERRACLKPREWPCRARFSPPTVSHHEPPRSCPVAMSCLDVMYHQSYGAHYLPAAAYKATYYNHHHQQQQVRRASRTFCGSLRGCLCLV